MLPPLTLDSKNEPSRTRTCDPLVKSQSRTCFRLFTLVRKNLINNFIPAFIVNGKFSVVLACPPMLSSNVGANVGVCDLLVIKDGSL